MYADEQNHDDRRSNRNDTEKALQRTAVKYEFPVQAVTWPNAADAEIEPLCSLLMPGSRGRITEIIQRLRGLLDAGGHRNREKSSSI